MLKDILQTKGDYYDSSMFIANKPGSYFKYSNFGFGVLGTIVEAVSGERFDHFV